MRGKDLAYVEEVFSHGITPRLCGEKLKPVSSLESRTDHPPPMRGKD